MPEDKYPTIVVKEDGTQVPVVQAFAFGKYLGLLNVTFDSEGNLIHWSGNPILLNYKVPQGKSIFHFELSVSIHFQHEIIFVDPKMLAEINDWNERVSARTDVEIGRTRVLLDGDRMSCRRGECNLGNVVADAQVFHVNGFKGQHFSSFQGLGSTHSSFCFQYLKFADGEAWADVTLGIVHSGSIRLSISERSQNGK